MDHSGLTWRKSSRSGNGGNGSCVEIARTAQVAFVRDSKNPSAGVLTFPASSWASFLSRS